MSTIPTRRPLAARVLSALADLPRRLWLELRIAEARWNIDSTETYLIECEANGIVDSLAVRQWRQQLAAERVRLATLESQR